MFHRRTHANGPRKMETRWMALTRSLKRDSGESLLLSRCIISHKELPNFTPLLPMIQGTLVWTLKTREEKRGHIFFFKRRKHPKTLPPFLHALHKKNYWLPLQPSTATFRSRSEDKACSPVATVSIPLVKPLADGTCITGAMTIATTSTIHDGNVEL